jgi:hypothetical protein
LAASGQASSDSYALRVGPSAGGAGHDVTGVVAGTAYVLMVQVKVSDASETVFVGVNFIDLSGNVIAQQSATVSTTTYSQARVEVSAPANVAKAVVYVWKNAGAGCPRYSVSPDGKA